MAQQVVAGPRGRQPEPLGVTTYALTQAVLLFWWVASYPGLFGADSLDHIWQSTTGNWNTDHPVPYTALVWLSLRLTGGIGALTLAQTAALAAGLAYAVTGLRRVSGPAWGWATAAVSAVALPSVGTFAVCVWADVPFLVCHAFLLGTLARLVAHRRTGAGPAFPRALLVATLVELSLIALFRQHGIVVVAIVTGLIAVLVRGTAVRAAVTGLTAASIALAATWLLLPALGVRTDGSIAASEAVLSDIAIGYADDPAGLPAADAALLARVAPLAHWRRSADCYSVEPVVGHPDFDRRAATAHRRELLSVWWRLARRSPGTVLAARICRGSIAWRPTATGGLRGNPAASALSVQLRRHERFRESPSRDAAYSGPLNDRIAGWAEALVDRSRGSQWLLWRGATWAYLAYLVVSLIAWRRRDRAVLTLAALSLGNQLAVLALNTGQATRQMAAPILLGVLLLPLLLPLLSVLRAPPETTPDGHHPGGAGPAVSDLTVSSGTDVLVSARADVIVTGRPRNDRRRGNRPDRAGRVAR